MKCILHYNLHNILRFEIERFGNNSFRNLLNLRFSCFQTDKVEKPDISLRIGRFAPSRENCYLVDHKYYIKENYFYCRESEGKASWEMEVEGLDRDKTQINCHVKSSLWDSPMDRLRVSLFLPQSFLLRIIEHRLSNMGYFLTHSAAVSMDGRAYLLSSRAGGFKTSLCMDFVRRAGFTCLGDDRVILSGSQVLGFLQNSAIFNFMTQKLPDETRFGAFQQAKFLVDYLFGSPLYNKQEIASHEKAGSQNGYFPEKITKPSRLTAIFLIARSKALSHSKKVNFQVVSRTDLDQIISNLITGARLEDFSGMGFPDFGINSAPFLRYMLAYSFVFPRSNAATSEKKAAELLKKSLEDIPIYKVEIPYKYSLETFKEIYNFINRNC